MNNYQNNTSANNAQSSRVHIERFTCPGCAGTMQFSVEKQEFVCSSCGYQGKIETMSDNIREYDFSQYQKRERESIPFEGMSAIHCNTCGSEIALGANETATFCPMCGSSHVVPDKQQAGIPPEGLIPFKIDQYEAQQLFHKWVKSRWFAPNALKKTYQEGNLNGLYIPFWTFDADAVGRYQGMGGHTRTYEDSEGNQRTTIDWYPVSGVVSASFDDIQICASQREGAKIIQNVEPYDTINQLKPYSPAYLSGYKAEHYSVRADEGFEKAKEEIRDTLNREAENQIRWRGYDHANVTSMHMTCSNVTYKHVLLPVYTSFFAYGSKQYNYAINGENGRVSGERPYSIIKISLAVLAAVVVFMLIYTLTGEAAVDPNMMYGLLTSLF